MEEKLWRIRKWVDGGEAPPKSIELIPTDRCNSKCLTCWMRGVPEKELNARFKQEMSDKRLLRLVDEAAELGVYEFALVGGGEPIARPITFKLMKRIREHGMHGDLVTNGTLFTEEQIEELVRMGWDRIKFSVDGTNPEVYDTLRGLLGGFECLKKNMLLLKQVKEKYGSSVPKIQFNVVISKRNYLQFLDIVEFAREVGCEEIGLLPMTIFSDDMKKLKLDDNETRVFQEQIRKAMKRIEKYGISSNMHEFLDKRMIQDTNEMDKVMLDEAMTNKDQAQLMRVFEDRQRNFQHLPCYMPWHHLTVLANGNIAPCFMEYVWNTKTTLKDHSLRELWYGPYFERFRKQLETRRLWNDCATCCVWRVFENREIRKSLQEQSG